MNFKNLDTAKEPNTITVFGVRLGGGGGGHKQVQCLFEGWSEILQLLEGHQTF